MAAVLIELEEALRSKPTREKMTPSEERVLETCKIRAFRGFTVGFFASSAALWAATRRLAQAMRFNLSLGSAIFVGMWRFDRSLNTCLDQILRIEGSRIQRELANIILTRHPNDTIRMKLVSEHFYPEQVFNDLNPDKPTFRWRSRNFFMDSSASLRMESLEDGGNHDKHDVQSNQSSGSLVGDMIADPLDCIFGDSQSGIREVNQSDNIGVPPRRRLHAQKKANRRHRAHHSDSSDSNTSYG